jgi:dipeptidyl aminopeptidase/acylaminoacyl peptidase
MQRTGGRTVLKRLNGAVSVALAMCLASAAFAETPAEVAAMFGARESVEDVSLSPDGLRIAYLGPGPAASTALYVRDVADDAPVKRVITSDGKPERLSGCHWVSNTRFDPYAVDPAKNLVYGFDDKDGRQALYSISLDGALTRTLVLAHPQVDVDSLIRVGRQRRVVGVSYATDRRQIEFFDPELRKLQAALAKALPNAPLIEFVDASADESKLLLWAGSDANPGSYYLYTKTPRGLEEVMPVRLQLDGMKLASVKPVTFPAADGTLIPAYLTLPPGSDGKNLPAIVMPHGGPGARDEWIFDWLPQFFAMRGYAVLQPNYRGSTGYGDGWFQKNGFQSWRTAIGDVNDGGRWLQHQGIAAPGKLAIVGWSYGGYAALQSAVLDPDLFKAIVAVAPVTDLETLRGESRNFVNFPFVDRFIGNGPHVREGSPARNAGRIKAPVLLFHGDRDENVGVFESRMMERSIRDAGGKVEFVEFKDLDHQLDSESARKTLLGKSDAFLRATLGIQP